MWSWVRAPRWVHFATSHKQNTSPLFPLRATCQDGRAEGNAGDNFQAAGGGVKGKHSRSGRRNSNLLLCRRPTDNANIANSLALTNVFPSELQHALIGPWGTHVGTHQNEEVLEMGRMESKCLFFQNWTHWDLNPGPSACGAYVIPLQAKFKWAGVSRAGART